MPGPLAGLRIIDLTTIILGPYAGQLLGDMGADVIKIEAPGGDPMRTIGHARNEGMGSVYLGANRNKRSLVLDLKQASAREALTRLATTADAFLHNMRPQAIERLGLGYETIRAANPGIVYCGTYGFQADGPYGTKPAYDDMIQAASGFAALQGWNLDGPTYATSVIADKVTGMFAAHGVVLGLLHKERTGEGQFIEVPMMENLVAFNLLEHLYGQTFEPKLGSTGYPRGLSPNRRPYATADGHIGVLPYSDKQWHAFFEIAGRHDLAEDPRFASLPARLANIDAVYAELAACVATKTTAEWLEKLDAASVPCMVVNSPDDLIEDPHLKATGFWQLHNHPTEGTLRFPNVTVRMEKSPGGIDRLPPHLGEHSEEVLTEAGLGAAEIAAMIETGATIQAPAHLRSAPAASPEAAD